MLKTMTNLMGTPCPKCGKRGGFEYTHPGRVNVGKSEDLGYEVREPEITTARLTFACGCTLTAAEAVEWMTEQGWLPKPQSSDVESVNLT